MALVTKRKPSAHTRKRQANHHRRNKHYMKAYTPYLPMLAIVGVGGLVNEVWAASSSVAFADPSNVGDTRLAIITGGHSYTLTYTVLAITFLAFLLFVLTHWYRFHRMLNRGEAFMVHHPWFDVSLVFVVTAGVVLTRP